MKVAFVSAFRNCAHNVPVYLDRVKRLTNMYPDFKVRVIAGEGDSVDNTRHTLEWSSYLHGIDLEVVDVTHGGPEFDSTEKPERMKALSKVCNTMLDAVRLTDDFVVYIESDIVWKPETVCRLLNAAEIRQSGFDIFAPMVWAYDAFYDTWGFRRDGERFSPFAPYHKALLKNELITEIDSAGSCLVMRAEIAQRCRIRNEYCLVGWCEDARSHGYRIGVCRDLGVNQL